MAAISRTRVRLSAGCAIAVACLAAGCYRFAVPNAPVTAEHAPDSAWRRLERLESFSFRLNYHTDSPFSFGAAFFGVRQSPDRERWQGQWRREGGLSYVEFRAAGDAQYERTDRGWLRLIRGAETRILEQVRQVVEGRKMEPVSTSRGVHRYRFSPWLPLLDPGRQRKFTGLLEVEERSGLPLRVYCSDSLAHAEWELRLGSFGRAGKVVLPFVAEQKLEIAPATRVSRRELGRAIAALRARLDYTDRHFSLERKCGRLVLMLEHAAGTGVLELLLARGKVEVWSARRASPEETTGVLKAKDASLRLVLKRLILTNAERRQLPEFEADSETGQLPEPRLHFTLKNPAALALPAQDLLVLMLDDRLTDWTASRHGDRLTFSSPTTDETARMLAALARTPPLPTMFQYRASR